MRCQHAITAGERLFSLLTQTRPIAENRGVNCSVVRTISDPNLVDSINTKGLLEVIVTRTAFLESGSVVEGRSVPGNR